MLLIMDNAERKCEGDEFDSVDDVVDTVDKYAKE